MARKCWTAIFAGVVLSAMCVCLQARTASAVLVERDLFSAGDNLLTFDTATNLEWLDVDQTLGLSFNQVTVNVGGWLDLGFVYASIDQVSTLYSNAGVTDQTNTPVSSNFAGASELLVKLGCTGFCSQANSPFQQGLTFDGGSVIFGQRGVPFVQTFLNASMARAFCVSAGNDCGVTGDGARSSIGSYLIREASALPEPATIALFGLGLVGLGLAAGRRRQTAEATR